MTELAPLVGRDVWDRLATEVGRAAARDVRDLAPIGFGLPDGRRCRFAGAGNVVHIDGGVEVGTDIALDESAWRDFVAEIATGAGLHYGGRLRFERGAYPELERWEPALRALFSGRPIFDPSAGQPLDPRRAFSLRDADTTLAHFLYQTGYLHIRGVFAHEEVVRLSHTAAERQAAARPGDGRSWWATRADGTRAVCRLVYLGLAEPAIAGLSDDPRLRRLMALSTEPLYPALDRSDGHSLVLKVPGVVEGLADLPWHRDCGLGGHPVTCPALNIGIQLDAATAESGRLHFVPGSWRSSCHRADLDRATTVAIDTEPGDCTVHFGDVMHAAPPPTGTGAGRRALYLTCMPRRAYDFLPAGRSYNDVIRARVGR